MLATEYAGVALNLAGWRFTGVVLRYFVAVRLVQTLRVLGLRAPLAQHVHEAQCERGSHATWQR